MAGNADASSHIVFYSKPGCPLCEEGFEKVERTARRFGLEVKKIDIHSVPHLTGKHGERIPVVEFRGEEIGWGRVSEKRLERELARRLSEEAED